MTEDEMVGWHHRLNGHESGHALRDGEGRGGLACYSLWDHKESDTTEQLNNNKSYINFKTDFQNLRFVKIISFKNLDVSLIEY